MGILPLLLLPVLFYFLLIRPQQRRTREAAALRSAISEGDEVLTASGIYGFVTAIEDDVVWLEIAEGIDIRIVREAIAKRVTGTDEPAATTPDDASDDTSVAGTTDTSAGSTASEADESKS